LLRKPKISLAIITSDMSNSVVPRGFSRYYVLSLLKEKPMNGKEIMVETAERSGGAWKPSPGLVYPLLGKLLSEELIEETDKGYSITPKGEKELEVYLKRQKGFPNTFDALSRIGVYGKFLAQDVVDAIMSFIDSARQDLSKLGSSQREKYKKFLTSELKRMEAEERKAEAPIAS
jgi:DNA-binding PadR family transcriptional regulator